ncbi:MAG: PQQ-dependent sugar dehydrogenase, partial [Ilumatobacteraceae bacterium]
MRRVMLALLVMVPALVTLTTGPASQVVQAVPSDLPPGFSYEGVVAPGGVAPISRPTAVEALPNDRIVVLEQHTGRVRLLNTNTGAVLPGFALDLLVCTGGEQGLLGFTEDPDFASNGRVYAFYTTPVAGRCRNRISAFTMSGDTISPASEDVLVEINTVRTNHNGGDLEVGNDGYLYITVGDGGADPRGNSGSGGGNNAAQDLSILHGKVLRVDRFTGLAPSSNPFFASAGAFNCGQTINFPALGSHCREIFLYGARNPYRFAFDPNVSDTRFFFNDVGQSGSSQREEVNEAVIGGNFGWNICEGTCGVGGLINPITEYPRTTGQYITGGA